MSSEYYTNVSGAVSCSSSRWLTEEVFKLIDMVQRDEAIYNPRHKYYFCRPYVENFWREVDLKLEKNPGASLAKWTNLRISFRREYTNYLEEKVPPCWSYFDRMFFLHPYLRKKHQQPKSLDSQVQDALVRISSLSDRLQRERTMAAANTVVTLTGGVGGCSDASRDEHAQLQTQQPLDNYLEYFDDPEQNNSELEDIMDEEQQSRFQNVDQHLLNNEIKSECDDNVEDYEPEHNRHHDEDDNEADDTEMRRFMLDPLAATSSSSANAALQEKRHQLRVQHWNRLQTRSYHEELRAKRPRSQESISSTQASGAVAGMVAATTVGSSGVGAGLSARMVCSSTPSTHANVSFVRPTLAKPCNEMVSTTSSGSTAAHAFSMKGNDNDLGATTSSASNQPVVCQPTNTAGLALHGHQHQHAHQRHLPSHHGHHHHGHRLEIAAITSAASGSGANASGAATAANAGGGVGGGGVGGGAAASTSTPHLELCDCKTDPDAMFLMSLLPDIQKLNGRDRGKIKIAFQNILQDYLYPD